MKLLRKGSLTFLYTSNERLVLSFQFRSNDENVIIAQQKSFIVYIYIYILATCKRQLVKYKSNEYKVSCELYKRISQKPN